MMQVALNDTSAGLKRYKLAAILAWEDIKDRYRRSFIGPAWIVISFLAFILIKSTVFTSFFESDTYDFFSHLVIGLAIFGFVSAMITDGTRLFVSNRNWILSTNTPYTVYAHITALRAFVEFGFIGIAAVALVAFMGETTPGHLWSIPFALAVYYIAGFGVCLLMGPIGARYRDVIYAVQTGMRIMFFATPIIWVPVPGSLREIIATWNPLTYYLDLIRVPVIEGQLPIHSWVVVLVLSNSLLLAGLLVFSRTKRSIPVWL